jgi:hypothetical protein
MIKWKVGLMGYFILGCGASGFFDIFPSPTNLLNYSHEADISPHYLL